MLRMSKMTDYGIVLLTELAREAGATRTARELAARTGVPMPSVSKVMKGLLHAGLLVSQRGETVVIVGSEGGLCMPYEEELCHARHLIRADKESLGLQRRIAMGEVTISNSDGQEQTLRKCDLFR